MTTAQRTMVDRFTLAYIEAALWSSTDDDGTPLDATYQSTDIAVETREKMRDDCIRFLFDNCRMIGSDIERAGHDFWLTRNGHGAGFWDGDWPEHGDTLTEACKAFPQVDLYIGDDGLIYA